MDSGVPLQPKPLQLQLKIVTMAEVEGLGVEPLQASQANQASQVISEAQSSIQVKPQRQPQQLTPLLTSLSASPALALQANCFLRSGKGSDAISDYVLCIANTA